MTRPERVDVEVGSPDWFHERRQGVTASEIAVILGLAPGEWGSRFNLWWSKREAGLGEAERDTDAMQWGRDLEEVILRRFQREHFEGSDWLHVTPGGLYRHGERPWQMATPDGLAYDKTALDAEIVTPGPDGGWPYFDADPVAVVQVKTAGSFEHWGDEGTDDIPVYYRAQVLWEMDVMGVGVAYVPVLFRGTTYREYVVEYDPEDAALMRQAAEEFLDDVANGREPEPDWTPATTRTLKDLHLRVYPGSREIPESLWREWVAADRLERLAGRRKRLHENRIRSLLEGFNTVLVNGEKVGTRSVYEQRRLDAAAVKRNYRLAYDSCSYTVTVNRLNLYRPMENEK